MADEKKDGLRQDAGKRGEDAQAAGAPNDSIAEKIDSEAHLSNAELELMADAQGGSGMEVKRIGYAQLIWRRFVRQKSAMVGLVILVVMVLLAVFGPFMTKFTYTDPDFTALNVPPNARHWFGTDGGGFDLFACVVHGLGRSLTIGIVYAVLTTIIAAIVGTAIAYARGIGEKVGMWLLDMLLIIPSFLLVAMIVRSASGTTGWITLILGLTAFGWIGYARTLRTMALSLRERDYVRAAKYMGVPPIRIIVRHLIPNLGSILILDTVLGVISGINSETAYSFLGLGIKAPDTSLGYLLSQGSSAMLSAPWVILIPSVVLIVLCVSMQLIGDGLRDAIDPYSRAAGKVEDDADAESKAEAEAAEPAL
ncbi:MAG: ABC transporter permease [Atopobiaceae bacterium]|nr:ABC transporter permease [Olsenella sp.]MDY3900328.1 ABC transporter permease [Atopobiaceae bacterium]